MQYLAISNRGLVDLEALTLIGASSKRDDDSKIGFFGSGFKYAIATLLRNFSPPRVFSGDKEITITTQPKHFRGTTYQVIYINGQQTSMTTEAGPQWKVWEAIRDIWANAIDEGEAVKTIDDHPMGEPGYTSIFIPLTPFVKEVWDNWHGYFVNNREVLIENKHVQVLEKLNATSFVGVKGFRAMITPSIFDYNFKTVTLNEARQIASQWDAYIDLIRVWGECKNVELIERLLSKLHDPNTLEYKAFGSVTFFGTPTKEWELATRSGSYAPRSSLPYLSASQRVDLTFLPDGLFNWLNDSFEIHSPIENSKYGVFELLGDFAENEKAMLDEAIRIFELTVGPISNIPIRKVRFQKAEVIGLAKGGNIYLASTAFEKSITDLLATLLEEFIHHTYSCDDYTRQFQTKALTIAARIMMKCTSGGPPASSYVAFTESPSSLDTPF